MYLAFIDPNADLPPLLITSLSLFGKSCLLWSSIIYVLFNREIFRLFFKISNNTNINNNNLKEVEEIDLIRQNNIYLAII
jgi:hypothetical protein